MIKLTSNPCKVAWSFQLVSSINDGRKDATFKSIILPINNAKRQAMNNLYFTFGENSSLSFLSSLTGSGS